MRVTDENAAQELAAQNPDALTLLMRQYSADVFRLARRILGEVGANEDVEECVSEVFVQAWRRCAEYDADRATLRTWILILTKYQALDVRRRLMRLKHCETPVFGEEGLPSAVETGGQDVVDSVLERERIAELEYWIERMPKDPRELFIRRYVYYESIEEIATVLGTSRRIVDTRLWRLRKWLRERLENRDCALEGGR